MSALAGIVAGVLASPAAAQLPAEPPLAASSNVHVLAHVPGSAAGMVFKDHYAFVSGWGGITVLDIAKADSPGLAGVLSLPHFENEDVDLCGNTLIVVNDRVTRDIAPARPDRERPRLRAHRQLRQDRLLAAVG